MWGSIGSLFLSKTHIVGYEDLAKCFVTKKILQFYLRYNFKRFTALPSCFQKLFRAN